MGARVLEHRRAHGAPTSCSASRIAHCDHMHEARGASRSARRALTFERARARAIPRCARDAASKARAARGDILCDHMHEVGKASSRTEGRRSRSRSSGRMQSLPGVSLPYWDFTIDKLRGAATRLDDGLDDSPMWRPDWFGRTETTP